MNITFIAKWLFGSNSEILHSSYIIAHCQKLCKQESIFKQKHFQANACQIFLPRKYDVISQLHHSYAKALFAWRGSYVCSILYKKCKQIQVYFLRNWFSKTKQEVLWNKDAAGGNKIHIL